MVMQFCKINSFVQYVGVYIIYMYHIIMILSISRFSGINFLFCRDSNIEIHFSLLLISTVFKIASYQGVSYILFSPNWLAWLTDLIIFKLHESHDNLVLETFLIQTFKIKHLSLKCLYLINLKWCVSQTG